MTYTAVSLVDGAREMLLYPRDNVFVLNLAVGSPTIRVVTENRPDDDGESDSTARHGGRAVALDLRVTEDPEAVLDELTSFTGPAARPYLVMRSDAWAGPRRLRLRTDQWSAPVDADMPPNIRDMQAQWRAPDGIYEAVEESHLTVPVDIPSPAGVAFPITFPFSFAGTGSSGAVTVTNIGNTASHHVTRLYGPITAPRLINMLTGEQLAFTDSLVLGAGEYVEVDTREHSANLNGDPAIGRLGHLSFASSRWWRLQPGVQNIRYTGTAPSAGAQAVFTYRPAWL